MQVFIYGAQYADPRDSEAFWHGWDEFELNHGAVAGTLFLAFLRCVCFVGTIYVVLIVSIFFGELRLTRFFWGAGNEDTYKEMLRIKRSVALQFTQNRMMTTDMSVVQGKDTMTVSSEESQKKARVETEM